VTLVGRDSIYSRYAFIDFCSANAEINSHFKYFDKKYESSLKDGLFPELDCQGTVLDENDLDAWNKLNKSFNYFKCAKISKRTQQSYLVARNLKNNGYFNPFNSTLKWHSKLAVVFS
jgi:hypothetical protein